MSITAPIADHEGEIVVVRKYPKGDKVLWMEPEDAIKLAQQLMDAAAKSLEHSK